PAAAGIAVPRITYFHLFEIVAVYFELGVALRAGRHTISSLSGARIAMASPACAPEVDYRNGFETNVKRDHDRAQDGRQRSRRSRRLLAVTISDAPVSASTAIHSVAK